LLETAVSVTNYGKIKEAHSKKALIKIRLVGDKDVGKTCLVQQFELKAGFNVLGECLSRRMYPHFYSSFIEIDGEEYGLILFDGLSDAEIKLDNRFSFIGEDIDVWMIVFSVVEHASYLSIKNNWIPELKVNCPNSPIILVGNKTDLRNNADRHNITTEMGKQLSHEINAVKYLECSSIDNTSAVETVFVESVWATLRYVEKKRKKTQSNFFTKFFSNFISKKKI